MNAIGASFVLLLAISCCFAAPQDDWESFKQKHGKSYNAAEEAVRKAHFEKRSQMIAENNAKFERGESTAKMAHNHFSDQSDEEFLNKNTGVKHPGHGFEASVNSESVADVLSVTTTVLPTTVDWVASGAVTPVKNQGSCGSCYSFSTTGAMEGQYWQKHKTLLSFSEEQIVDCGGPYGLGGCNGGWMDTAFQYINKTGGIETEAAYAYTALSGNSSTCKFDITKVAAKVLGFVDVAANEAALQTAVANIGPIAVAISVTSSIGSYSSGLVTAAMCGTAVNHGVLVVGYGTLNGVNYWKVKNSWSSSWGIGGYFLIPRGSNMCLISNYASYPIMA